MTSAEISCPRCGKETVSVKKGAGKGKGTKATKVPCPFCGEPVSKRSKKCPACRTALPQGFYKTMAKPVDGSPAEPAMPSVESAAEQCSPVVESIPADLGTPTLESPPSMPIQDRPLAAESTVVAGLIPPKEPVTGSEVREPTSESAVLQEPLPVTGQEMKIEVRDGIVETATIPEIVPAEEPAALAQDEVKVAEPSLPANATIPQEDVSQAIVAEIMPTEASSPPAAPVSTMTSQSSESDMKIPESIAHDSCASLDSPSAHEGAANMQTSSVPPICEAIVPRNSLSTSSWIESLIEKSASAEQAQPIAEPVHAAPKEVTATSVAEPEKKPMKAVRKRKLKSPKTSSLPAPAAGNPEVSTVGIGNGSGPGNLSPPAPGHQVG